jgi:hypothetical protein
MSFSFKKAPNEGEYPASGAPDNEIFKNVIK